MTIPYIPALCKELQSVAAAILLIRCYQRFVWNGNTMFYKFKEPCGHRAYRPGDSWCEELNFSRRKFDIALAKIGSKVSANTPVENFPDEFVCYYTDKDHMTYYWLNINKLAALLTRLGVKFKVNSNGVHNEPPPTIKTDFSTYSTSKLPTTSLYADSVDVEKKLDRPRNIDEVVALFKSKGGDKLSAQKFFYHYDAHGWKRGGTPISNWESLAGLWIVNNQSVDKSDNETLGEIKSSDFYDTYKL